MSESTDKPVLQIVIDQVTRTYRVHDGLLSGEPEARPLPAGDMPWLFKVDRDPEEASQVVVDIVDEQATTFDVTHATACSVIAIDAWITDKVFETHDDTIYIVRVVNTSTHYVAEDICIDIEIDPTCDAVAALLPDKHSLIEIQPAHQCIKCLAPRNYVDLRFVAISRGPMPGVFPVRACVTYDLVYWTRAQAKTHARLEIEVHDECRTRRDPCLSPRRVPPDPGDWKLAPQPQCPPELFGPCSAPEAPELPPLPEDCVCEPEATPTGDSENVCIEARSEPEVAVEAPVQEPAVPPAPPTEVTSAPPPSDAPTEQIKNVKSTGHRDEAPTNQVSQAAGEGKEEYIMSNDKAGSKHDSHDHCHDPHCHEHHHLHQHQHHQTHPKKEEAPMEKKGGCAPACSNAEELLPIIEDCRLPEGGTLGISYTFRKGFVAASGRGGKCVYGKHAQNGRPECRMESIDDTILVMDVTNHSHFHLKHVRIHGIRIFQNHEEVTLVLPSGHPVAQIVPSALYVGSLARGETKWVAMSFITRGVAPGMYAVKFCVDYDIEACTVGAAICVEIKCD